MKKLRTVQALAAIWMLIGAWGTASAVSLELVSDNIRDGIGNLNPLVFKTCAPAMGNGCINPANPWVVANGVTGSTAIWSWDGATLTASGVFWSTAYVSSNPSGKSILSDKTLNMVIDTTANTTTATSYNCIEGNLLQQFLANGCLATDLGINAVNNSSAVYNVGGNANCVTRFVGGDDSSTGPVRTLATTTGGGGCDAGAGAYDLWTVVTDNTSTGGQLIVSNGISISAPNTHFLTFNVSPVPVVPAVWLFGSALGVMGVMRRKINS